MLILFADPFYTHDGCYRSCGYVPELVFATLVLLQLLLYDLPMMVFHRSRVCDLRIFQRISSGHGHQDLDDYMTQLLESFAGADAENGHHTVHVRVFFGARSPDLGVEPETDIQ